MKLFKTLSFYSNVCAITEYIVSWVQQHMCVLSHQNAILYRNVSMPFNKIFGKVLTRLLNRFEIEGQVIGEVEIKFYCCPNCLNDNVSEIKKTLICNLSSKTSVFLKTRQMLACSPSLGDLPKNLFLEAKKRLQNT